MPDLIAGIDVSKSRLDVQLHPTGERFEVPNDARGHRRMCRRLKGVSLAALEASGGYEKRAAQRLAQAGVRVCRLNPHRVRRFAQAGGWLAKTDRIDAEVIARCAAVFPVQEMSFDPALERLREHTLYRAQLVEQLTAARNQSGHFTDPSLRRRLARRIRGLERAVAEAERAIAALVQAEAPLRRRARQLRSAPGVGPVLAHTLMAFLPELGSLTRRQVAALAGLAPFARDSGAWRGRRSIWGGRACVRKVLYMAALAAARAHPLFGGFYRRLIQRGKTAKVALVAVMRKLLVRLNAMIRDDQHWSETPSPIIREEPAFTS